MGWDQSVGRQSVRDFLLELMEINPDQLLEEALHRKMEEGGLTCEVELCAGREEGDGMYNSFTPDVVKLSDGRVFVEALTESINYDDSGSDYYSFVEVGKPFTFTRNSYCGCEDDPHVTTEEMISTEGLQFCTCSPCQEMKDQNGKPQHHYGCKDLTGCHPFCALADHPEEEE